MKIKLWIAREINWIKKNLHKKKICKCEKINKKLKLISKNKVEKFNKTKKQMKKV